MNAAPIFIKDPKKTITAMFSRGFEEVLPFSDYASESL